MFLAAGTHAARRCHRSFTITAGSEPIVPDTIVLDPGLHERLQIMEAMGLVLRPTEDRIDMDMFE
ncbi:MAG: hypothetical protein ACR2NZ_18960 [Rubripirellula sp.]